MYEMHHNLETQACLLGCNGIGRRNFCFYSIMPIHNPGNRQTEAYPTFVGRIWLLHPFLRETSRRILHSVVHTTSWQFVGIFPLMEPNSPTRFHRRLPIPA